MSVLLVDIGNTRCKFAWRRAQQIDMIAVVEDPLAALDQLERAPESVWIASVRKAAVAEQLADEIAQRWSCPVRRVQVADHARHLPTDYAEQQLGVDRWLALLAAKAAGAVPAVVVDSGTAITLDVLDASGRHAGGYILPGTQLMREALLQATAIRLPEAGPGGHSPARDTRSAIEQAAPLAVLAFIEQLRAHYAAVGSVVLGGGAAAELSAQLREPQQVIEQLVLQGLAELSRLEEA